MTPHSIILAVCAVLLTGFIDHDVPETPFAAYERVSKCEPIAFAFDATLREVDSVLVGSAHVDSITRYSAAQEHWLSFTADQVRWDCKFGAYDSLLNEIVIMVPYDSPETARNMFDETASWLKTEYDFEILADGVGIADRMFSAECKGFIHSRSVTLYEDNHVRHKIIISRL